MLRMQLDTMPNRSVIESSWTIQAPALPFKEVHGLTRPALPRVARPPLPARPVPLVFMDPEDGLLLGFVWL